MGRHAMGGASTHFAFFPGNEWLDALCEERLLLLWALAAELSSVQRMTADHSART